MRSGSFKSQGEGEEGSEEKRLAELGQMVASPHFAIWDRYDLHSYHQMELTLLRHDGMFKATCGYRTQKHRPCSIRAIFSRFGL